MKGLVGYGGVVELELMLKQLADNLVTVEVLIS
jgi:hypothetical protein